MTPLAFLGFLEMSFADILDNMLRKGVDAEHPSVNGDVNYVFAAGTVASNRERLAKDGQHI